MLRVGPSAPPAVYLIADHLDAVLAAGEDLRKLSIALPPAKAGLPIEAAVELRAFIERIQAHEMTIILRLLAARRQVAEMPPTNEIVQLVLGLFTGGTHALVDAATECGDPRAAEFATAGDTIAYLHSRGMLPEEKPSLVGCLNLSVTEDLLITGRVPLGAIMDHAAAVIDALEASFELYSDDEADGRRTSTKAEAAFIPPVR